MCRTPAIDLRRVRIPWRGGFELVVLGFSGLLMAGDEPVNPFGTPRPSREDARTGRVETSDGKTLAGQVYLTRDTRLRIQDSQRGRPSEIPLSEVRRLECRVEREWIEKEWRFKEAASDEKVYTGKTYPVRVYRHTLVLKDGREISGAVSAVVYVTAVAGQPPQKFLLHQRDKGPIGTELKQLVYVRKIELQD